MRLTAKQSDAMVWLGEPPTPQTFVTEGMIQELAGLGIVVYDPTTGKVRFTEAGAQAYRDTVGHWPARNI
jgi:hypothetical protein